MMDAGSRSPRSCISSLNDHVHDGYREAEVYGAESTALMTMFMMDTGSRSPRSCISSLNDHVRDGYRECDMICRSHERVRCFVDFFNGLDLQLISSSSYHQRVRPQDHHTGMIQLVHAIPK